MMLRDRFIIGFNKGAVQSKLFKEAITRTFAEVIEVAVAEMAAEVPSGTASNFTCVKMEPGIHHVTSRNMKGQMTSTSSTKDQSIQLSPSCYIQKYEGSNDIYVINQGPIDSTFAWEMFLFWKK
ncbi:hypothetical protein QE152_g20798 [Popillia japonica]|uniref:Uncharacterized protein n=1 Tax=Popillia japonica TaxID=7064 RepID=A0AAW1KLP0_POPJA